MCCVRCSAKGWVKSGNNLFYDIYEAVISFMLQEVFSVYLAANKMQTLITRRSPILAQIAQDLSIYLSSLTPIVLAWPSLERHAQLD
jgi:hypothetical protein